MSQNCPLCGEPDLNDINLRYHMGKIHQMDFSDNNDMVRRLGAIGITIVLETQAHVVCSPSKFNVLHG